MYHVIENSSFCYIVSLLTSSLNNQLKKAMVLYLHYMNISVTEMFIIARDITPNYSKSD
jgi:hypothetical protein